MDGRARWAVLFVASVAGLRSSENIGAYGVSKAAVINLTTQLAVELGPRVRVNAVAPAVVKTRFAGALYEGREAEVAAGYPVGRLGGQGVEAAACSATAPDGSPADPRRQRPPLGQALAISSGRGPGRARRRRRPRRGTGAASSAGGRADPVLGQDVGSGLSRATPGAVAGCSSRTATR